MSRTSILCAALLLLLLIDPAWAGPKKQEVYALLASVTVVPLALYPIGLALNLLALGFAPRRSEGLTLDLEEHYWKSLLLGLCNTAALFILSGVFGERVPLLSFFFFLMLCFLSLAGIHGMSRRIGEWILTRCGQPPDSPIKALALGWFVFIYIVCIPMLGWFIGLYWVMRGIGAVILQLAGEHTKD